MKKYLHFLLCANCEFVEKSVPSASLSLAVSLALSPTLQKTESNTSFSQFLSADDHMCCGFDQALGTSVCSHPLSLLSSTHFLIQQKYVLMCVSVCVCVCVCVSTGHSVGVRGLMSPGGSEVKEVMAAMLLEFHMRASLSCLRFVKFTLASL